jgi:hypothetical protein
MSIVPSWLIRDRAFKTSRNIDGKDYTGTIYVNICKGASIVEACQKEFSSSSVYFVSDAGDKCENLMSHKITDNEIAYLDPKDEKTKMQGLVLKTKSISPTFTVTFHCDSNSTVPTFDYKPNGIRIESSDACAYVNEPAKILFTHKYILSGLSIILGAILVFAGGYKWNIIVGVFGFFTGMGSIFFIFWAFVNFTPETTSYVIITVLGVTVGILLAFVCTTIISVSYAALGFVGGFFLSKYLILIFQLILDQWKLNLIYYGSGVALALICLWLKKRVITLVTAFIGSVMLSYNIGFITGLLGNFFDIVERIKAGEPMEPAFYVFVGIAGVFAVVGMIMQFKWISKEEIVSSDHDDVFLSFK